MANANAHVPTITLNNGVEIPQLGFGVWQIPPDEVATAVGHALDAGYRSIDTAAIYGNEEGVGEAIRRSGLPRDEVFVTSKLWNDKQGYDEALRAFDASLDRLKLDHLDLYLIHWPAPMYDRYVPTWKALEKLLADGRVRAIGVSNFHPHHLERLLGESEIVPAVDQVELHPYMQQRELESFLGKHGIVLEDYSPLAHPANLIADPVIVELAEAYGKTPAQIVLRWHVQIGHVVIPKSATPARIVENIGVFDFELADADRARIDDLERGLRTNADPETFG